jgi:hypothetical protein
VGRVSQGRQGVGLEGRQWVGARCQVLGGRCYVRGDKATGDGAIWA